MIDGKLTKNFGNKKNQFVTLFAALIKDKKCAVGNWPICNITGAKNSGNTAFNISQIRQLVYCIFIVTNGRLFYKFPQFLAPKIEIIMVQKKIKSIIFNYFFFIKERIKIVIF